MAPVPRPRSRALLAASPANDRTPDRQFAPGRLAPVLGEWHAKDARRLRGARPARCVARGGALRAVRAAMGARALAQGPWARSAATHARCAPWQCQSPCRCRDSSHGLPVSCLSSRCFKALPHNAWSLPNAVRFYNNGFSVRGMRLRARWQFATRTAGLPARIRSQPGSGAWNGEAMPWRAHGTRHSLQLAAWNCMVPSRQVTAMVWPGPKRPSNKAVESGFSKLRWMARFMGLAP